MATRGVIITGNSMLTNNRTSLTISNDLDRNKFLKHLTYWDEIHYVGTNIFGSPEFELNPEYNLLIKENKLHKCEVNFTEQQKNSLIFFAAMEIAQLEYYSQINNLRQDMKFSISQSGNVLNLPTNNDSKIDCIELSIENLLPVPTNCNFEQILEFKEKRKSELLALRIKIEELKNVSDKISKDEIILFKERLQKCLLDINKVMDESKFQKVLTSMKTYLNLQDSAIYGALLPIFGMISSEYTGLTYHPIVGTFGGFAANAAINIFLKKENKIANLPKETQDFAYLYYLDKLDKKKRR